MGQPHLDAATAQRLVDGLKPITATGTVDDLSMRRDALLAAVVAATHKPAPGGMPRPR